MPTNTKKAEAPTLLCRTNYVIILLACVAIVVGFVLMAGDASTETTFEQDIFSVRRIVIAPMVCLIGYLAIIIGILWRPYSQKEIIEVRKRMKRS